MSAKTNFPEFPELLYRGLSGEAYQDYCRSGTLQPYSGSLAAGTAVCFSNRLETALQYAKKVGARSIGIVGRDGGYTAEVADVCILIPTVNADNITPHAEAFQAVVWHLMVSHPKLKATQTKWESVR